MTGSSKDQRCQGRSHKAEPAKPGIRFLGSPHIRSTGKFGMLHSDQVYLLPLSPGNQPLPALPVRTLTPWLPTRSQLPANLAGPCLPLSCQSCPIAGVSSLPDPAPQKHQALRGGGWGRRGPSGVTQPSRNPSVTQCYLLSAYCVPDPGFSTLHQFFHFVLLSPWLLPPHNPGRKQSNHIPPLLRTPPAH